jgi:hypothetical protein
MAQQTGKKVCLSLKYGGACYRMKFFHGTPQEELVSFIRQNLGIPDGEDFHLEDEEGDPVLLSGFLPQCVELRVVTSPAGGGDCKGCSVPPATISLRGMTPTLTAEQFQLYDDDEIQVLATTRAAHKLQQLQLHEDHEVQVAAAMAVQSTLMALKNKLHLLPGELTLGQKRVISDAVGKKVVSKQGARNALVSLCGLQVEGVSARQAPSQSQSGCAIVGGLRTCLVFQLEDHSPEKVKNRSSEITGKLKAMTIGELKSINDKFERVQCALGMVPEPAPPGIWDAQSAPQGIVGA